MRAWVGRGVRLALDVWPLDSLPEDELERVVNLTRNAGRDAGRLGDYYLKHRNGPTSAASSKAAYLLRDTLKVVGFEDTRVSTGHHGSLLCE